MPSALAPRVFLVLLGICLLLPGRASAQSPCPEGTTYRPMTVSEEVLAPDHYPVALEFGEGFPPPYVIPPFVFHVVPGTSITMRLNRPIPSTAADLTFSGFSCVSAGTDYDTYVLTLEPSDLAAGNYAIQIDHTPCRFDEDGVCGDGGTSRWKLLLSFGLVAQAGGEPDDCLEGATEEIPIPPSDAAVCGAFGDIQRSCSELFGKRGVSPRRYRVASDSFIAEAYLEALWTAIARPLDVIFDSHGDLNVFHFYVDRRMRADELSVRFFADSMKGKIKRLLFFSCCTAKPVDGEVTMLDYLAQNMSDGKFRSTVCGYTHKVYYNIVKKTWNKIQTDELVCKTGGLER